MTSDDTKRTQDVRFKAAGLGMAHTWRCFGCHQPRQQMGSRGLGLRKRCAACVAKREAA